MGSLSDEVIEGIEMAIEIEKEGRKFYLDAADKTDNELAKKMFSSLADDESAHIVTFQKIFDTMSGSEEWRELANVSPRVGKVPVFEGKVEKRENIDQSDLDALRIAMDSERKSIELYRKTAAAAEDPLAEKIFSRIEEEEKYHYDLLQAQYDSLTNSGFWLDVGEFRMDARY